MKFQAPDGRIVIATDHGVRDGRHYIVCGHGITDRYWLSHVKTGSCYFKPLDEEAEQLLDKATADLLMKAYS